MERISHDYINALHLKKYWKSTCFKERRKIVLQRKNVIENILVQLQRDNDDVIMSHPFDTRSQLDYYITCSLRKKKNCYKERMFLRTLWWNYKEIRMTSLCSINLQLIIAVLFQPHVGCLKRLEKKRMFFITFFTWNNTFFATLRIKQQSKCTWVVLERTNNNCMFMYISSELQRLQPSINIATYQGNWQELTIQKNSMSLSCEYFS